VVVLSGGAPCTVDIKNGKIVKLRPRHYDWKYDKKEFNPWKFHRNGKTIEPIMKSLLDVPPENDTSYILYGGRSAALTTINSQEHAN